MTEDNHNRRLSRRNVIRSSAALSSLGLTSFLASGTGAARSRARETQGKYGYGIDDSGHLVYYGDTNGQIRATVEAINEKYDDGELDFAMENGVVVTQSQSEPESVVITAAGCAGKNKYKSYVTGDGMRHKLWIDHCNCNDIVDMLSIGVEVGVLAAAISAIYGNIPAAVASAVAIFLMRTAKAPISNNDEGEGIVVAVTTTYFGGNLKGGGLEPQH
ncbi:hypothetical protein [Natrinema sp. 1APR25-10V2]|uniref:hypothetical protein n=1 Tax=Natrinema sp. 1APR25-10V2 TaxID=2951081 RepID=UPI0028757D44|nr:hypothetical protein [Natrinema sp. 1APR25-10V2]MDS0473686.1 hypothetical protein [Natrinema sp. 1APR25-10V2]